MILSEKQSLFLELSLQLMGYILSKKGHRLTYGQTVRTVTEAAANAASGTGISNSLHTKGLAIDLNLFIDGEYQKTSEAHREFGEYWKTLNPLCRWGGDFTKKLPDGRVVPHPDGNHYSLEHEGVK